MWSFLNLTLIESYGLFSSKSFFKALISSDPSPYSLPTMTVWSPMVSLKVKAFVWLLVLNKVNSNDVLLTKKTLYDMISPNMCLTCMEEVESTSQVFMHCKFTYSIWCFFFFPYVFPIGPCLRVLWSLCSNGAAVFWV